MKKSNILNESMDDGHCTIPEVGSYFGVKRTTTYKLLAEGKLEGLKIGGRRVITRASMRRLAAASTDIIQKI